MVGTVYLALATRAKKLSNRKLVPFYVDTGSKRSFRKEIAQEGPALSIIIPVYNDPNGLRTTLESLTNQTTDSENYEIIVVDNDSKDATPKIALSFADKNPNLELYFERERQGSYAARNTGIEHAAGEVFAFVDADMSVPNDYVELVIDSVTKSDAAYFGCKVDIYVPDSSETLAARHNKLTGFPIKSYVKKDRFAPTCCLIVQRDVLSDIGMFDERLISSGDKEFGQRVYEAGYEQAFLNHITLHHPARTSLRALSKKHFRIGRGLVQLQRHHPEVSDATGKLVRTENFLPMRPKTFVENHSLSQNISDWLPHYCLWYALILTKTIGRFYEWVRMHLSA